MKTTRTPLFTMLALVFLCLSFPVLGKEENKAIKQEHCIPIILDLVEKMHVSRPKLDAKHGTGMIHNFLLCLDPGKTIFLREEVDAIEKSSQSDMAKIISDVGDDGDLSYFRSLLEEFNKKQLPRHLKMLQDAKKNPIRPRADEAQEKDELQEKDEEYPQTLAEMKTKVSRMITVLYGSYLEYLDEGEALEYVSMTADKLSPMDPREDVMKLVLRAYLSTLDSASYYYDAKETAGFHRSYLGYSGLGVSVRGCPMGIQVLAVAPGGAAKGNVIVGEQIVDVDGKPLAGMDVSDVVDLILGPDGTPVKITVRGKDKGADGKRALRTIVLNRRFVASSDSAVEGKTVLTPAGKVGIVSVKQFCHGVAAELRSWIEENSPMSGLVLDLRDDPGGLKNEAVWLSGLFVDNAPIVGFKGGDGNVGWDVDDDSATSFDGPMVLLVNQHSASASEIVAGALRDIGRAVVVGGRASYGKGTVQVPIEYLPGIPGRVTVTIGMFFRPDGGSVQRRGVDPDILISAADKAGKTMRDEPFALQWEKIAPHGDMDKAPIKVRKAALADAIAKIKGMGKNRRQEKLVTPEQQLAEALEVLQDLISVSAKGR